MTIICNTTSWTGCLTSKERATVHQLRNTNGICELEVNVTPVLISWLGGCVLVV